MSDRQIRPMRALLAGTVSLALLAGPALAAPGGPAGHGGTGMGGCGHPGILTVAGHGESRVAPDQVMISLGVTTQSQTAAQAMTDNSARQQAVLDTLKGVGIEEADIQTSGLTLNPMMNYPENAPATITGYMAQNLLTVRVTDISRAGEVLDSIVTAGANEMQGIRFIREDSQSTEDEALGTAVADATHRAGVMAEAAGLELGPIIRMGEPRQGMNGPEPVMMRAMGADAAGKSIPVEGGEVAFTADVEVTYALKGGEACAMPMPAPQDTGAAPADTAADASAETPEANAEDAPAN
ncbi:SIMPL domain-containing protein [Paracoccus xiamenensis]|uniref:SIMPL domain-containing protein n=1 Tax=Paracoccus xiamenensis TaxID=2714901 RepID=UPI0014088083|nr:SIMPL domain-containing protein [Paracoccus xiamenensis]NHF71887.1 SIMPL domain-containing protein [Paracoccus xiamenensis]